jgi:hypothetical protein
MDCKEMNVMDIQIVEMNCAVLEQLFLEHVFWVLVRSVRLNFSLR